MTDSLPPWLWIPAAIVLWTWMIVALVRDATADPYEEDTGLDVLQKTGHHPHG